MNVPKDHYFYELENVNDIGQLDYTQRFSLYLSWLTEYADERQAEIQDMSKNYNELAMALRELRMQEDRSIMENSFIIAMTTTGASRYHAVLKDIAPRIVIVEEAAEVFEAHVIAALSKECEHLILIGDHNQLRPNPAVYKLVTDYNLDISLFERLVMNDTKKVMLTCQHRMRPEISVLMRHFYEQKIFDAESVMSFEDVRGLNKNIFFFNHDHLENRLTESKSKANFFEVKFLVKLCQFLLRQAYAQTQITVLTMYLGQMSEVRKRLRELNMVDIKVTTVDNYQGEENDFILLSLVRSNTYGNIGFLEVNNRVCVGLSRARKGSVFFFNLKLKLKNILMLNFNCKMEN